MGFAATAQTPPAKAVEAIEALADTTPPARKYMPTGVRVGIDALSLVRSTYDKNYTGWEANADIDFDRYYLALDYGSWARTFDKPGSYYNNDGRYFRAGVDVNFLTKDPDRNMFFIGARYGRGTFSENLRLQTTDPVWGPVESNLSTSDVKASWFELTTGLRVKMWKMIWMGYTARFKFGLSTNESDDLIPHDVPGYGRTDKESTWGFNYQIFIKIPFRPLPAPPTDDR